MPSLTRDEFLALVRARQDSRAEIIAVPIGVRLLADQLTPVLAYRRLVSGDERTAPSFLLESVEGGERQGRYSIMGARPILEVVTHTLEPCPANCVAGGEATVIRDHPDGSWTSLIDGQQDRDHDNPIFLLRDIAEHFRLITPPHDRRSPLPACFLGGWVGYAAYDTVRFSEPRLQPSTPRDDRNLPDLNFAFYDGVVAFDHVDKLVHAVQLAMVRPGATTDDEIGAAYDAAVGAIERRIDEIQRHSKPLPAGRVEREAPRAPLPSNTTREQHRAMVERAKEYIRAGDIFQVVLGQRFERTSTADPFDVYRALRAVNPSPYMVYMQGEGCILVASSPEILCRVRRDENANRKSQSASTESASTGHLHHRSSSPSRLRSTQQPAPSTFLVTNRPLAGTRRRGTTPEEDSSLERELLADQKECAEHIMLVDLGRNDVGRVAIPGSIELPAVMEIERYSHVMHISSTVTGVLRDGLDCWDALIAALPVGTISGAPKIRAMQIIDELEPVKRGPYGGGMGCVGLDGQMDIALALRTIVVPTALHTGDAWTYHLQAAGGIVADSEPEAEYMETVNKSAALARAIDVAEQAFGG